jgi:hypothetical protein
VPLISRLFSAVFVSTTRLQPLYDCFATSMQFLCSCVGTTSTYLYTLCLLLLSNLAFFAIYALSKLSGDQSHLGMVDAAAAAVVTLKY